jgi:hypothetical protein
MPWTRRGWSWLVVQVLLGFQLTVVLEHRFDQLSTTARFTHVAGLAWLLGAFVLAVAPATYHRIAEAAMSVRACSSTRPVWIGLALSRLPWPSGSVCSW